MAILSTTLRNEILSQGLVWKSPNYFHSPTLGPGQRWELRLKTSGNTILARINITSWTIADGVATVDDLPLEATAVATGTAAKADLYVFDASNNNSPLITDMTVGSGPGYEIQMADTTITAGQPVQLISFRIIAPTDVVAG